MKANEQTLDNKRKIFDKFQLDFTNPLTIRSKQDYLQYTTEVINPSQVINLLETDEDLFNLLNQSELQFDKQQLRVTFKIANKPKSLVIQFKKRSADEQISCLASLVGKISLERDQLLNKNLVQQRVISQKDEEICNLKKISLERDQLLKKNQAQQKTINEKNQEISQRNENWKLNYQNLERWHSTHCAKCGKLIEMNFGNAYGRPTCSQQCKIYVLNTLKWDKIFNYKCQRTGITIFY